MNGLGVSQPVSPAREVGVYAVSYVVVAVDGHLTCGGYTFVLTQPAVDPSQQAALPLWWWVVLGVGFLGLVFAVTVLLQGQSGRPGRPDASSVSSSREAY